MSQRDGARRAARAKLPEFVASMIMRDRRKKPEVDRVTRRDLAALNMQKCHYKNSRFVIEFQENQMQTRVNQRKIKGKSKENQRQTKGENQPASDSLVRLLHVRGRQIAPSDSMDLWFSPTI